MHKKYAKDGLGIISVALDPLDPDDKKAAVKTKQTVLGFLQEKGATFTNLLLDEPQELYQEKLRFQFAPCYYVFSRQGKWTQFRSDDKAIDYQELDRLILELLKEK